MGACCCCCLRAHDYNGGGSGCCCGRSYYPSCLGCCCGMCNPTAEEQDSSSVQGASSSASAGLLVGVSLDTSIPDTYRAPPTPLPYDADVRYLRTRRDGVGAKNDKSGPVQSRDSQDTSGKTDEGEGEGAALAAFENLRSAEFKSQGMDSKPSSPGKCQPSKLSEIVALADEEDVCPTCLEGYDKENPRIITKCEHNFHLGCILEWMERSDSCPICGQEMRFDEKPRDV
uniref:RING-type E3 ubiquitin transferase n=1 Tax=Wollemia nobilis TaxID=56998 RepID=A0A0C9RWB8_9CONI